LTAFEPNIKQQKCIHHWIIDSPNASTSRGRCKKCGAVATFLNDKSEVVFNKPISDELAKVIDELINRGK
jgi:hypothetical protein